MRLCSVAWAAVDRGNDSALAHDRDAVADREQLGQVRRHDDDRPARLEQLRDEPVDVVLGANVDAFRGLVEHVDLRVHGQPAADEDLLLVAAGEPLNSCSMLGVTMPRRATMPSARTRSPRTTAPRSSFQAVARFSRTVRSGKTPE